ncbi:MAG: site-2 protease family protein [Chloroflexota bacterium]
MAFSRWRASRRPGPYRPSLTLFRVFGISCTASPSAIGLVGLLVYAAHGLLAGSRLGLSPTGVWALSIVAAALSVIGLYGHELSHALVARRFGIPVKTINLFLLGGVALITRESPTPKAEFWISLAGPLASLGIGIVSLVAIPLLGPLSAAAAAVCVWLAAMNLSLVLFNLLPAFPLDGGRVLRAMLWFAGRDARWATRLSTTGGQIVAAALVVSGVWTLFDGRSDAMSGLWLILIAWFMYVGAATSGQASAMQEALRPLTVASIMDRQIGRVPSEITVQAFADGHLLAPRALAAPRAYGVYRDEDLLGLVSMRRLETIPTQEWPATSVQRAMQPIESTPALEPGAPALRALQMLLEDGAEQVAVMIDGRLLGLVTSNDLARASQAPRR